MLHFSFGQEIGNSLKLMKFASINHTKFKKPGHAYFTVFLQFCATLLIEAVNIFNLVTNSDIIDIIMNFLALGVLADFDDYFLLPLMDKRIKVFAGLSIPKRDHRKDKHVIKDKFILPLETYNRHEEMLQDFVEVLERHEEGQPMANEAAANDTTRKNSQDNKVAP